MNVIFEDEFLVMLYKAFMKYNVYGGNRVVSDVIGFCSPKVLGIKIFGDTEATIIPDRILMKSSRQYNRFCTEIFNRINGTAIHELIHEVEEKDSLSFSENEINYISFLMLIVSQTDIEIDNELIKYNSYRFIKMAQLLFRWY